MRDEDVLFQALQKVAQHPITYGFAAGLARFLVGDRQAGWRALITSCVVSVVMAAVLTAYLFDEPFSENKKLFFTFVGSFLARDLLIALLSIGSALKSDPLGFAQRVLAALKGSPKQ